MLWQNVDKSAAACCEVLWRAGFEAYPVGGCVRDLLLGRTPGDWDVTTNALPEQVTALFDHTVPTGIKHGTVTVILDGTAVEVTTFRTEGGYSDGRHPDGVRFDATLEQDLARRDFTINAMALGRDGSVMDPFGGQADLKAKIIRCVGDPDRRFSEDALRMFRAVRFGAQLGFLIEEKTIKALRGNTCKAELVAGERVRVEVEKTLCSARPEQVKVLFDLGLMAAWSGEKPTKTRRLSRLPAEPMLRWAGLCACMGTGNVEAFLRGLKLDAATIRACGAGWELWRRGVPADAVGWRKALIEYGADACRAGAAMAGEDALCQLEAVLAQNPYIRVEQLALSGGELAKLGLSGPEIGRMQRRLLAFVAEHPMANTREQLLAEIRRLSGGSCLHEY